MNHRSTATINFAFIDVETNGVDPRRDRVVEVAGGVVRGTEVRASFASLANPERSIPAVPSAIHHLTDALGNDIRFTVAPELDRRRGNAA